MNEKTRQQIRETHGLVDSLVGYIKASLEEGKAEDKVSHEDMELKLSCCFCSTPSNLLYSFACASVCTPRGWKMRCVS